MEFLSNPQGSVVVAAASGGAPQPPLTDYYIGPSGNDTNSGTSEGDAWATFAPLKTAAQAAADDAEITCRVLAGTYDDKGVGSIGANINNGVYLTVYIDEGAVFDGPAGVDRSFIDVTQGAGADWTIELRPSIDPGPNVQTWTSQGYDTGTGNGVGMNVTANTAHLIVRNVLSQGNIDGWSCHGANPHCHVYDSVFKSCSKSAASHVHTAGTMLATRCEFWGNPGGSTLGIYFETTTASTNTLLEDCKFIPTGTVTTEINCDFRGATLRNCQIGTLTVKCTLVGSAQTNIIEDSYINAAWDQNRAVNLLRCYGKAQIRMRNTAIPSVVDHCVWVDSPTGAAIDGFLWANFDPTSMGQLTIQNSVIRGFSATAIGNGFTATYGGYWTAASCALNNNDLFGNGTNIDADITTGIAANITTDPQMPGAFNTVVQADYVVGAAGPCVGAGTAGSNIGFTAADIS